MQAEGLWTTDICGENMLKGYLESDKSKGFERFKEMR
jgi:hypothetical protein